MAVNEALSKKIMALLVNLSTKAATQAHQYIGLHRKMTGFGKYPVRDTLFSRDDPKCEELFNEIPVLKYNIAKYNIAEFPDNKTQYGAIFSVFTGDRVKVEQLDGYDELYEYISGNPELKKIMIQDGDVSKLKNRINMIISGIVERYLYSINASEIVQQDMEERIYQFAREKLARYFSEKLRMEIYIPICLATFEDDYINLSDGVEIVRITDELQKSRQQACQYESVGESWLSACATHMIVLHNYCLKNKEYMSISSVASDHHTYPLDKIDSIFAVIRVVTGYSIGYEQILMKPLDWVDEFCADLTTLYGAKTHSVNSKEINKKWFELSISVVTKNQIVEIQKLYKEVLKCEDQSVNRNVIFALKRLNRCMLRENDDDMAIDATIGIEALLSGGCKEAIAYTISNRIPVVFAYEKSSLYSPQNSRAIMNKIYNYRSRIVHGDSIRCRLRRGSMPRRAV